MTSEDQNVVLNRAPHRRPILREVLKQRGTDISTQDLTEHQKELKERWIRENGFWNYDMDSILKLDTDMFEAYMNYSAASANGALDPQTRELIYIAVNASPTRLEPMPPVT